MDLTAVARLRALLDKAPADQWDALLASHGLDDASWQAHQLAIGRELVDAATRMDSSRLDAFIRVYRGDDREPSPAGIEARTVQSTATPPRVSLERSLPADQGPSRPRPAVVTSPPPVVATAAPAAAVPASQVFSARPVDPPIDRTGFIDLHAPAPGPSLPFARAAALPERPAQTAVPVMQSGLTTAPGRAIGPAMPFRPGVVEAAQPPKANEIDLSMMPLERYAEIIVALASGEDRERVFRRFVLTEAFWQAIAQAWAARIAATPRLKAEFDQLVRKLRTHGQ